MSLQGLHGGSAVKGVDFLPRRGLVAIGEHHPWLLPSLSQRMRCPAFHPRLINPATFAGGQVSHQLSHFLRNSILFYSVLPLPWQFPLNTESCSCSPTKAKNTIKQTNSSVLSCFPGATSVLWFPSPVALQITLHSVFVSFPLTHSIHQHLLPLKWIFIHKAQQAHFRLYQVRWLHCTIRHWDISFSLASLLWHLWLVILQMYPPQTTPLLPS